MNDDVQSREESRRSDSLGSVDDLGRDDEVPFERQDTHEADQYMLGTL